MFKAIFVRMLLVVVNCRVRGTSQSANVLPSFQVISVCFAIALLHGVVPFLLILILHLHTLPLEDDTQVVMEYITVSRSLVIDRKPMAVESSC